jgi:Fe-S cluster biogenesis protein NfuA
MRDKVEEVIKVIRPAIQADNGDIFLRDVDEDTGVVSVELVGACVSCPASTVTLKAGIERILKDRVAGVTQVLNVGEEAAEIGATGPTSPFDPAPPVSETSVSL